MILRRPDAMSPDRRRCCAIFRSERRRREAIGRSIEVSQSVTASADQDSLVHGVSDREAKQATGTALVRTTPPAGGNEGVTLTQKRQEDLRVGGDKRVGEAPASGKTPEPEEALAAGETPAT
jgi:hypothetical protein